MAGLEGQKLGNYEILTKLGQGGMGAVYKARDTRLQRFVAIKVLPVQLATDEEFVHRFQREAIAAAQFCHSNLVQVFDIGESNDLHFIIMELVEGESLGHRLQRKGRMTPREAVAVTIYIGQALAYAWNKAKLIHRDIKPANIFLSKDGEVKLGDLGLAKSLQDAASGLTLSGTIMGTPHYMSPEQGRGDKQLDFRSDIYSLGCVLYHMLTGDPPYQGDSTATLIYKHVHEAPRPLREVVPDCPEDLVETVDWMMAKKPEDRPQTYEELLGELAAVRHTLLHAPAAAPKAPLANVPSHAPVTMAEKKAPAIPNGPKSPSFGLIMAATVVVSVLLLGLFIWSPWASKPSPVVQPPPAAVTQRPPVVPVTVTADAFIKEVAALPAEQQVARVVAKLKELNAGFNTATVKSATENGQVTEFEFSAVAVADISPVRALSRLGRLKCEGTAGKVSPLADLSPLKGMPLTNLLCSITAISDLSPLAGMPLTYLNCFSTPVRDLSPLKGMPLKSLRCGNSNVEDLSPLKGTPLATLSFNATRVADLSPLKGMPLQTLQFDATQVRDLRILRDLPLRDLKCDFVPQRDAELLRSIKTLEKINNQPAAEFWKQMDAGNATVDGASGNDAVWRNAINLLPLIDPQQDAVYGQWKMEDGACVSDGGGDNSRGAARLQTPYHPPEEYDYRITFTRRGGTDAVMQFLAKESLNIRWVIGADGGRVLGFEHAGGSKHWSANPTTVQMNAALPAGTRHTSVIQVRKNGLTAYLDGKIVTRWPTDYSDFMRSPGWGLRDELALGLGSWQSPTVFNSAEVLEVTGRGKFTRPDDPAAKVAAEKRSRTTASISDAFIREVAALPAEQQVKRVVAKLKELNPTFDPAAAHEQHSIENGAVTMLALLSFGLTDISPLRALPKLRELSLTGSSTSTGNIKAKGSLKDLAPLAGMKIEKLSIWGNQISDLSPLKGMPLAFLDCAFNSEVSDLTPLAGMRLKRLVCTMTKVSDLSPLKDTGLNTLTIENTPVASLASITSLKLTGITMRWVPVQDLSPLRDMPLTYIMCESKVALEPGNRTVLQSIKSLDKINTLPAAEFWEKASIESAVPAAADVVFIKEVAALPAEQQVKRVVAKLKELNPGYDGKEIHRVKDGRVDMFAPISEEIANIVPVAALKSLEFFGCGVTAVVGNVRVKLSDLSPLRGLPLKIMQCPYTCVRDLSPLQGMPLTMLTCNGTPVSDLTPLRGMKLLMLTCQETEVRDLSVLRDMPLRLLFCDPAVANDEANRAILRSIKTLEKINNQPVAEFWRPAALGKQEIKTLFNGKDLTGWRARNTDRGNEWHVRSGTLVTTKLGADLVTEEQFTDFLFHCEFKLAARANSGVYLRGRYEIQLMDDHGKPVTDQTSGGIYKVIIPSVNAIKAPGVWQTLDAAVAGQRVQVILNGKKVIENGLLSKPTAGALDQNIDQAGPLLLQSFTGQIEFRNLLLMPLNPGVNLQALTFPAGWPSPRHN